MSLESEGSLGVSGECESLSVSGECESLGVSGEFKAFRFVLSRKSSSTRVRVKAKFPVKNAVC